MCYFIFFLILEYRLVYYHYYYCHFYFPNVCDFGVTLCCLPDTPAEIICIPTISKDSPIIIPAKTAPNNGDANTRVDMTTFSTPTPMRKTLTHPLLFLFVAPSIILANPSNSRAKPRKYIMTRAAAIGNAIAKPAKMMVSIPSPMVAKRDLCAMNMPVMIFSTPTKIIPLK
jgi:hypothetical protein